MSNPSRSKRRKNPPSASGTNSQGTSNGTNPTIQQTDASTTYAYNKLMRKLKYWAVAICVIAYIVLFSMVVQIRDNMCSCTCANCCPSVDSSEITEPAETDASSNQHNTENTTETSVPSADKEDTSTKSEEADTKPSSPKVTSSSYNRSPEYYEKQAVADLAIERYYNDEWDGSLTEIDGHTVSISKDYGCLLVDSCSASSSNTHSSHIIDLPPEIINNHTALYIHNDGAYDLVNNRLVKYSHGKEEHLSGGPLNWDGMDTENYRPYDVYFYYDEAHDTLFVVASSVPYDYSSEELKYNIGIYLYVIPNRTKSELKFVDEIINLSIDDEGLFYQDTSQNIWRYVEKDGNLQFVRASDKLTSEFSRMGIAEGEIEFDWCCTFADGFIGKREPAFPDGTFSHPVVTTPSVSLIDYVPNYRYRGIYSYFG